MFTALRGRQWQLGSSSSKTTRRHIHNSNISHHCLSLPPLLCCPVCAVPTAPLISSLSSATSDIHPFTSDIQGHSNLPFTLAFSNSDYYYPHLLAVADEDGHVSFLHTDRSALTQLDERRDRLIAHNNAIFDISWNARSWGPWCTLATASADQTVKLWNVGLQLPIFRYEGHSGSVKCVTSSAWMAGVWASGGRDGCARVWDDRVAGGGGVACVAVDTPQRKRGRRPALSAPSTVTAVTWLDERLLCTASSSSASARVWDVRFLAKGKQRCVKVLGEDDRAGRQYGVSSLDLDNSGQHLLLSCTNHELVCYHWPSATRHSTYTSHKANFYTRARFSPDGRYIACGSVTGAVHVYRHDRTAAAGEKGSSVRVMRGHEDEVGCVGWSRGDEYVVASCSDDLTVRVWRADRAAKSEEGEGDDRLGQSEESELTEEGKAETCMENASDEMMGEEQEESDKENEPHHHALTHTQPSLLSTSSSSSSSSSRSPSPFLVTPLSEQSPSLSREPLADITNAIVDPRPTKRSKLSSFLNKPLLAFFSPVDSASTSLTVPSSAAATTVPPGKGRRADARLARGSSPTLLDFWALPAEQAEDKTEMDTEY